MHRLARPATLSGFGPLEVFRAVAPTPQQEVVQTPRRWALSTPAYAGLKLDPRPITAAALHAAGVANVIKVWTELAYESIRVAVVPTAPSRLESLYAMADVYEAFAFNEVTNTGHWVHRGVVAEGVPWQLVDMRSFIVAQPRTPDGAGFDEAWRDACVNAHKYWLTGHAPPDAPFFAEILVQGELRLDQERLHLLNVMESHGLVAL